MTTRLIPRARALAAAGLLALGAATTTPPAQADDVMVGPIKIATPWTRATPGGARVAGGFMTITNTGATPDRLVGGSAVVAGAFEVHEMSMQGDVMKMRRLENGLEIKAGETVMLKPGSYHVMMMNLKGPIEQGKPVKGTLVFEKAGTVEVTYQVAPIGAPSLDGTAGRGHGMKMKH